MGPKSCRSLDIWQKDSRFKDFVQDKWINYEVFGRWMFVFKKKLKRLKQDLKTWNRVIFGNVINLGENLKDKIQILDDRDDEGALDEAGREERRSLLTELNKNQFKQKVVYFQKAC